MKKTFFISSFLVFISVTSFGLKPDAKVLIIDGFSNHDWSYTTEVITSMLENSGSFEVDISTAPLEDAPGFEQWRPDFKKYDVIVQNCNSLGNGNYWPEKVQADFEKYMKGGGGLYVFHSGNNSFEKWEEYNKMIGLGWRKPDQGVAIEIIDGQMHRIPAGQGAKQAMGKRRDILVEKLKDHPINQGYPDKMDESGYGTLCVCKRTGRKSTGTVIYL